MSDPGENAPDDHAARLLTALRIATIAYFAYAALQVCQGKDRQFTGAVLPAAMVAALWFPIPEVWWFVATGYPLCAIRAGYNEEWAVAMGLIAATACLLFCRRLFFPEGRLFHWGSGALAAWLALMLFGLPRAEVSFFPTHSRLTAPSTPLSLEPLPSIKNADASQGLPKPAVPPPILMAPTPEAAPPPGGWEPPPALAQKLARVYELAPKKILEGKDSGQQVEALTIKLDDLLNSQPKDEANIEAAADQILAIVDPAAKPHDAPAPKAVKP